MSPQLYLGVDKLLLTCVTRCLAGKPSLTARIKAEPMPAPAPASSQCRRNKIKELLKTLSMDIFLTSLTPLFGEEFRWSRDWLRHVPFPAFSSRHQGIQRQVLLLGVASALPWHQASQDTCEPARLTERNTESWVPSSISSNLLSACLLGFSALLPINATSGTPIPSAFVLAHLGALGSFTLDIKD